MLRLTPFLIKFSLLIEIFFVLPPIGHSAPHKTRGLPNKR